MHNFIKIELLDLKKRKLLNISDENLKKDFPFISSLIKSLKLLNKINEEQQLTINNNKYVIKDIKFVPFKGTYEILLYHIENNNEFFDIKNNNDNNKDIENRLNPNSNEEDEEDNDIKLNIDNNNKTNDEEDIGIQLDLEDNDIKLNIDNDNKINDEEDIGIQLDLEDNEKDNQVKNKENNSVKLNIDTDSSILEDYISNFKLETKDYEKTKSLERTKDNEKIVVIFDVFEIFNLSINKIETIIKKSINKTANDMEINEMILKKMFKEEFLPLIKDELINLNNYLKFLIKKEKLTNLDYEELDKNIHKIKGMILNFRLDIFFKIIDKIEELIRSKKKEELEESQKYINEFLKLIYKINI